MGIEEMLIKKSRICKCSAISWSPLVRYYYFQAPWHCYVPLRSREGTLLCTCQSVLRPIRFHYRSITWGCIDLPSSNLVHTSIRGSRGTLLILGSLGQRSRSSGANVPKLSRIVCITISQNEFLLHKFVQLILNWLVQLYKTSVTKKSFRGHNVLWTSLVILVLSTSIISRWNINSINKWQIL